MGGDRGLEDGRALSMMRTVLNQAIATRVALNRPTEYQYVDLKHREPLYDEKGHWVVTEDPEVVGMKEALDQVIEALSRWKRAIRPSDHSDVKIGLRRTTNVPVKGEVL